MDGSKYVAWMPHSRADGKGALATRNRKLIVGTQDEIEQAFDELAVSVELETITVREWLADAADSVLRAG